MTTEVDQDLDDLPDDDLPIEDDGEHAENKGERGGCECGAGAVPLPVDAQPGEGHATGEGGQDVELPWFEGEGFLTDDDLAQDAASAGVDEPDQDGCGEGQTGQQ